MSNDTSSDTSIIYALNTFTLKDGTDVNRVVELIKKGVLSTSSKNPGYRTDKVFQSADGQVVINMSEWIGGLARIGANYQANEANPD